ncbi:MAG: acyl-CoA thioesterase [Planctomycetes bacterium]|nr:acyl-CoA thioesterase [Planctomycetota bacterium]
MKVFSLQQHVRFGHVDPAGIAYFPRLYDYIHEAFEELWDVHVGRRYYHLITEDGLGFPLVHSEVDFKNPLRFGDRVIVRISCFKLGRSSLGLRYVYTVGETTCLDARMTTVCVRLKDLESIPIPENYRIRFAQILETADKLPAP